MWALWATLARIHGLPKFAQRAIRTAKRKSGHRPVTSRSPRTVQEAAPPARFRRSQGRAGAAASAPPENISEHPAGNDRRETRPRPEKRKGDPIRSRLHRANQRAYRWATNMTTETVVPANSFSKGPCQAQFQPFSAPLFFAETGRIATNFPPSATKRAAASR